MTRSKMTITDKSASRTTATGNTGAPASSESPRDASREPKLARLRQTLDDYMNEKGLRTTEQRKLIVSAFFECHEHITIDELVEIVRAKDPRVGYATVYRTMRMLTEGGIANELHFGESATRYEVADDEAHHDHIICESCGLIVEFEEPLIEQLQERIAETNGFIVSRHRHELYGHCKDEAACQARRRAKSR